MHELDGPERCHLQREHGKDEQPVAIDVGEVVRARGHDGEHVVLVLDLAYLLPEEIGDAPLRDAAPVLLNDALPRLVKDEQRLEHPGCCGCVVVADHGGTALSACDGTSESV